MSELNVYEDIEDFIGYDDTPAKMYDKYEADLLITELKAENERLKRQLEHVKRRLHLYLRCC